MSLCQVKIFLTLVVLGGAQDVSEPDTPNSRTVLFKEMDLKKDCWSNEDLVMLTTRKYLQDMVPKEIPDDLNLLLKYFKWSLTSIKHMDATGDVQMTIISAFADTMGGYFQHILLPITHEAYYAGNINYELALQIHLFHEAMKQVLGSDGSAWAPPVTSSLVYTKVYPLWLNLSDFDEACKALIVDCKHTCDSKPPTVWIPMPFFDDPETPCAIAMPFRCRSLFSLMSHCASDVLLRYYSLSMRCLMITKSRGNILAFNHRFHAWLLSQVVPHLEETEWYPGFWGVMRIVERMRLMGLSSTKKFPEDSKSPFCMGNDVIYYETSTKRGRSNKTRRVKPKKIQCGPGFFHIKYVLGSLAGSVFLCTCCLMFLYCFRLAPSGACREPSENQKKLKTSTNHKNDSGVQNSLQLLYNSKKSEFDPTTEKSTRGIGKKRQPVNVSTDDSSELPPQPRRMVSYSKYLKQKLKSGMMDSCSCSEITSSSFCDTPSQPNGSKV